MDPVAAGKIQALKNGRVLINIKDTPDLVMSTPSSALLVTLFVSLPRDSLLD